LRRSKLQVRFEDRKVDNDCPFAWLDIDGVDCFITKQGNYPKAFYSHKKKTSALRYELATATNDTGLLCHIAGPFPAGDWPDISIFRQHLKGKLEDRERVNADDGYGGDDPAAVVSTRGVRFMEDPKIKKLRGRLRQRHETFNGRIKRFKILSGTFHHQAWQHSSCFRACCVAVQISLKLGEKRLFGVAEQTEDANCSAAEARQLVVAARARVRAGTGIDLAPADEDDEDDEDYDDEEVEEEDGDDGESLSGFIEDDI